MTEITCPKCNSPIDANDFNISTDLAFCRNCQTEHKYNAIRVIDDVDEEAYRRFVERYVQKWGREQQVTIPFTKTSLLYIVPFTCLWSGLSIAFLYVVPIMNNKFETGDALLGIPLLLCSALLLTLIYVIVFGKYRVILERRTLRYCVGATPFVRKGQIPIDETTAMKTTLSEARINEQIMTHITVGRGSQQIAFGASIPKAKKNLLYLWLIRNLPSQS